MMPGMPVGGIPPMTIPPAQVPQAVTVIQAMQGINKVIVVAIDDQTGRKFLFLDTEGCKGFEESLRAARIGLVVNNTNNSRKDGI